MMTSGQNNTLDSQGLLIFDGINIFDKDYQVSKYYSFYLDVLWPDYLYQKFDPINQEALNTQNNNVVVLLLFFHNSP